MKKDNFKSPDFYNIDTLFNEEQLLIRDTVREWVKENISPIIEDCALSGNFPKDIVKKLAEIGGFGGFLPTKLWWLRNRFYLIRIDDARIGKR